MRLRVKVVPRASRTELASSGPAEIRVRVAAPPEGGRANRALVEFLAEALGIAASRIRIVRGGTAPRKELEIDGVDETIVRSALRPRN